MTFTQRCSHCFLSVLLCMCGRRLPWSARLFEHPPLLHRVIVVMYELTGCLTFSDLRNAFNEHVVTCTEAWSVLSSFCQRVFANWIGTLKQGFFLSGAIFCSTIANFFVALLFKEAQKLDLFSFNSFGSCFVLVLKHAFYFKFAFH